MKNGLIHCPNSIGYPWLRLIKSKEKNPLISYNLEYIYETESVYKNKFESKNNYFCIYLFIGHTWLLSANEGR